MSSATLTAGERAGLLERFLRYVRVDTRSDDNSTSSPSTARQKDLGRLLVHELRMLGCDDARMDEYGYVYASIPSNLPSGHPAEGSVPAIGLIAHLDTYFGTPGEGVKPCVIERYEGGDIPLPGTPGQAIRIADNPNLDKCIGHTIVTSDGTTLLGADDKAGIAEILTAVEWMSRHPHFHHGPVRLAFTPDEEVGRGTERFDLAAFGARYAYTLDGSDMGEIEDETFCADRAVVAVTGHDVHPGYAKGKMVNALRVAAEIVRLAPGDLMPETTDGRQPYLHAYDMRGDVNRAEVKYLLRAFTVEELREREAALRKACEEAAGLFPGAGVAVEVHEQYRNMIYKLQEAPEVLENAFEAVRRIGIEPSRKAIRGGTDGARLSYMGVPTPNLWAGGQSFHSVLEWVSLEWMVGAVEATVELLGVWVERSAR